MWRHISKKSCSLLKLKRQAKLNNLKRVYIWRTNVKYRCDERNMYVYVVILLLFYYYILLYDLCSSLLLLCVDFMDE